MTETVNELERYQAQWESYWNETAELEMVAPGEESRSIWDMPPRLAVDLDVPRFKAFLEPSLPIVDFGCGNGTQTASLSRHYKRVIGTDVSASAIKLAHDKNARDNVTYEVLDAFDGAAVAAFHEKYGDVNIYMRFVLHQVKLHERGAFAKAVDTLLGARGSIYLYEMGTAAGAYFDAWMTKHGMPKSLHRILKTGAGPGGVDANLVRQVFGEDEYAYLTEGPAVAATWVNENLTTSSKGGPMGKDIPWEPPTYFAVLRRK
jgi:2-polyprenyl-3-methyl-5-hydroxy-6-metoxy-1,4-benzoquinol methylase